jgi:hypothetical protein
MSDLAVNMRGPLELKGERQSPLQCEMHELVL